MSFLSSIVVLSPAFLVTVKLVHIFCGIFIWEWINSLGFEWEVYTRKRPWRWSIGVYVACRYTALVAIIVDLVGFNLTERYNCEAWLRSLFVFSYTATSLASLLIVLRAVAIWARNKFVVGVTSVLWLVNVGFALYSITKSRIAWTNAGCTIIGDARSPRPSSLASLISLITSLTNLTIMFAGVLKQKNNTHATPLWRVLFLQGVVWIGAVAVAEVGGVLADWVAGGGEKVGVGGLVTAKMVIVVIAATRVYRELSEFISPLQRTTHVNLQGHRRRRRRHPFDDTYDGRIAGPVRGVGSVYGRGAGAVSPKGHGEVAFTASGPAEVSVLKTIEVDVELSTAVNVGLDTDPSGFGDDDEEHGRGESLPPNERSQQRPQHEEAYLRVRPPSIALPLPPHTLSGSHQWPSSNSNSTAHSPSPSQPWAYTLESVKELDGSVDSDDNEGPGECKEPLASPSMPPSLPPSSPSSFPASSSQTRAGGSVGVRRGGGGSDTGLSARSSSPRSGSQEER
ncbi:uncharacterized protein STEHIDRAFT_170158 [Stereum hirsutum FP-91666 SS1]|uniref:uncharacterized protein n=1 Tax=Stereum hirsutum (strain FP-91666) TaxID=721885 RepID=UPI000444A2B4|nr:uncharacterized protein STEHIDRAFT_170158 [Stereum hirsutum FP-91666 SS1]EIM84472.1 hypothetical protein STEHIDRAFT_170158 [Stereum hirsutum FP-91666 SS1]